MFVECGMSGFYRFLIEFVWKINGGWFYLGLFVFFIFNDDFKSYLIFKVGLNKRRFVVRKVLDLVCLGDNMEWKYFVGFGKVFKSVWK